MYFVYYGNPKKLCIALNCVALHCIAWRCVALHDCPRNVNTLGVHKHCVLIFSRILEDALKRERGASPTLGILQFLIQGGECQKMARKYDEKQNTHFLTATVNKPPVTSECFCCSIMRTSKVLEPVMG